MALRSYSLEGEFWGPSPDLLLPADHLARGVDERVESPGLDRLNRPYEHTGAESLPQELRRLQTRRAKLQQALEKLEADQRQQAGVVNPVGAAACCDEAEGSGLLRASQLSASSDAAAGTFKAVVPTAVQSLRLHPKIHASAALILASVVLTSVPSWPAPTNAPQAKEAPHETLFCLGRPDASAMEFGLTAERWPGYAKAFPNPVVFTVGKSKLTDWPYIHPSSHDTWAGGKAHTLTIRFGAPKIPRPPLFLILGLTDTWGSAELTVAVNGRDILTRRAPTGSHESNAGPGEVKGPVSVVVPVPAGAVLAGDNTVTLTLRDGSWIIYDYVCLGTSRKPLLRTEPEPLALDEFKAGPLAGVEEIVFAVRTIIHEHWYANFGYFSPDADKKMYGKAGRLCKLNLKTGKLTTLLGDLEGSVRDPAVHYDGRTMVFAYRKGGSDTYHLYTINSDGTGLRQLTDGIYDDIEPCWLPDGGIVFVSARGKRWVNCWLTQVANIYRCDGDGRNIRPLSANLEHDNTPWVLPDGRIAYMRWEYVDRNQVNYHHLWTMNPDGTAQTVFFGNLHPGGVYIDAKPIPGSDLVALINSPGHGKTEHMGRAAVVSSEHGPDHLPALRNITREDDYRDVWALSPDAFLAARDNRLEAVNGRGQTATLFTLPAEFGSAANVWLHEPRPLAARKREAVIPPRVNLAQPTGRYLLDNVYFGRNMSGIQPGEIKKLLVVESLPKPVNFTGGMDPLSYAGTFTLERVLGTVPVEPDGSVFFEAPALRSLLFVALDKEDRAVKRMQSFTTVAPGETLGCVGCHEHRTLTQQASSARRPVAATRAPRQIEPIRDVPDVPDFPRDIQPVLDRHCVKCHDYDKREGGVILTGDRGPMFSHSFYTLTVWRQIADGRNMARSNYAPRALGSGGSALMQKLDGSHHDVKPSPRELLMVRLWLDCGAPYPGTYAALGCGMIGGYQQNKAVLENDEDWPTTVAAQKVFANRCASCHNAKQQPVPRTLSDEIGLSFWTPSMDDPRLKQNRHIVFNLTRPDKSLLLLAPLAKSAGGYGLCTVAQASSLRPAINDNRKPEACATVFASKDDPDYRSLLAMVEGGKHRLDEIKRFDMPGFRPRQEWVREMIRYGVLPAGTEPVAVTNVYEVEQKYWRSLWHPASPPLASR